jgi:subtilase family serine protease
MRRRTFATIVGVASLVGGLALSEPASAAPHRGPSGPVHCDGVKRRGIASCSAVELSSQSAWKGHHIRGGKTAAPAGYGPADLQQAYDLTTASATGGTDRTVAIVDAYDDPFASSDLSVYRAEWGLPPICSGWVTVGCVTFTKVNQKGATFPLPIPDAGWSQEISVDLDTVSAICPHCNILLVESNDATLKSLAKAENVAATVNPVSIGNSYGVPEASSETGDDANYTHPGIAITAAAGDDGYGVQYPATSPAVIAVGGTTLTPTSGSGRGWTESAWSDDGSGCSTVEPQPSWQSAVSTIKGLCTDRAVADVAAVADPSTGVAVYDTYRLPGWTVFGGTSVATQVIAAVYALAQGPTTSSGASALYSAPASDFFDVSTGSNGACGSDLCTAVPGWDGPTGLGSPDGTTAF